MIAHKESYVEDAKLDFINGINDLVDREDLINEIYVGRYPFLCVCV